MNREQLHLVSHILCPYVQRSVIVLKEKNLSYERTDIDLDNMPDWFKRVSPMGKVPVLMVNESNVLFESAVICEYIDEITKGTLHPEDPLEKAKHRAWIEFGSGLLDNIAELYYAMDEKKFEKSHTKIFEKMSILEKEMTSGPFFSGENFQLIDAVYGPIFRYFDVFELVIDLGIFASFPKLHAWHLSLQQRESVRQAVTPEYPALLLQFIKTRNRYLSTFIIGQGS